MSKRDLYSDIETTPAFLPQALSGTTDITGTTIDTKGYGSVTFILNTDAIAAADLNAVLAIQEGDESDLSDASAVADADLLGTEAATQVGVGAAGNQTKRIGYKGSKRYVRSNFVVTANTGTDVVGCVCILGHPETSPVAGPSAG